MTKKGPGQLGKQPKRNPKWWLEPQKYRQVVGGFAAKYLASRLVVS